MYTVSMYCVGIFDYNTNHEYDIHVYGNSIEDAKQKVLATLERNQVITFIEEV